jgi:hypothetical protein
MTRPALPAPSAAEHLRALAVRVEQLPAAGVGATITRHVASTFRRHAEALEKASRIERLNIATELRFAQSVFTTSTVRGVAEAWMEASQAVDDWIEQASRPTLVEAWWHGTGERVLRERRGDRTVARAVARFRRQHAQRDR